MTVLVIDLGSSSVRALLFDDKACPIDGAQVKQTHDFASQPPGASTADAEQLRRLTEMCLDDILQHPQARDIRAVGMATFVGNLVGVDADGHAMTPVYTYADTQCADDVAMLRSKIDERDAHQRTGCVHHAAYHPSKLHWLKRTQPALFEQVRCWTDIGTVLYRQWFGRDVPCSYSVASWSGLLNREGLTWDREWLDLLGISPDAFAPLADFNAAERGLTEPYAKRWPVLANVPFYLALGDGAAANVGSGAVDENTIALTVGTTAALRMLSPIPARPIPDGLWCYRLDATTHLLGGATTEGGNIFQWASATLQVPEGEALETALASREPDAHGLTFLPLLAGERSPGWNANATGTVAGLRLSTAPLDILQAALEGVALRLSVIADQLAGTGVEIVAGGGALERSQVWKQMMANAFNRPLHLLGDTEITAKGVAAVVLNDLGVYPLAANRANVRKVIVPQPRYVERYRAARERQQALYGQMRALWG
jgi:gluconokinase